MVNPVTRDLSVQLLTQWKKRGAPDFNINRFFCGTSKCAAGYLADHPDTDKHGLHRDLWDPNTIGFLYVPVHQPTGNKSYAAMASFLDISVAAAERVFEESNHVGKSRTLGDVIAALKRL